MDTEPSYVDRHLDIGLDCTHRDGSSRGDRTDFRTFGDTAHRRNGVLGRSVDDLAEKTRGQNIADAGVLNSMRIVQAYMASTGNTVADFNQIQSTAQTNSVAFMAGLIAQDKNMVGANPAVSITYNQSTTTITATATVSFNFQPAFMGIFGINNVPESIQSNASSSLAQFVQVVFLVDVSGSMGVAGDTAALTNLPAMMTRIDAANVGGCLFACHQYVNNSGPYGYSPHDFRTLAKTGGPGNSQIKLKIDCAQAAVSDFTTKMVAASANDSGHLSRAVQRSLQSTV